MSVRHSTPRSFACDALPRRRAATVGSPSRATTWSTSAWLDRAVSVSSSTRLVAATEFDQCDRGVHAIPVLVRLRAERLAERPDRLVRRHRVAHRARRKIARDPAGERRRHPRRSGPDRREGDRDDDGEGKELPDLPPQAADRHARRDEPDDVAAVDDRHDAADRRTERAGELLGDGPARGGIRDRPEVGSPISAGSR